MKKIICLITFIILVVLSATSENLTQNDSTVIFEDNYKTELEKLRHDYEYLYCEYKLKTLEIDLRNLINDTRIESSELNSDYYRFHFDLKLYNSYKNLYISHLELYNKIKFEADAVKTLVELEMDNYNFSDIERDVLKYGVLLVDKYIDTMKSCLDHYKSRLDLYESLR